MHSQHETCFGNTPLRNRSGEAVISAIICIAIVAIVASVVFPLFARHRSGGPMSACQSDLKQIGNALRVYASDNDDMFPTNRVWIEHGRLGSVRVRVKLSQPDSEHPRRFQYGANWVEAIYPYIERMSGASDAASVWKCDHASSRACPERSRTAAVTYAFNRNLIEQPEYIVHDGSQLMMVREMDRLVDAELRPTNNTTWSSKKPPISPFLTKRDAKLGKTDPKLHNGGSYILYADGHAKWYRSSYLPDQSKLTKRNCWDPKTRQWYNYRPDNTDAGAPSKPMQRSIAITP